jgi:hypothetical protein
VARAGEVLENPATGERLVLLAAPLAAGRRLE